MTQQLRRAVPRQPADWFAFYRLDNVTNDRWRCCRIIDISPLGAGLELFDLEPDENLNGLVTISLELRGDTRSLVPDEKNNSARVGVTFPTPTEAAKAYVRSLNGMQSRW
jgi:hypothetical protein